MENKYKKRNEQKIYYEKEDKFTCFLYQNAFGRCLLKFLYLPLVSKIGGFFMNSSLSKGMIKNFIIKNNIDMNDYNEEEYKCFNDFFTRKIKKGKRPLSKNDIDLISPADSKLSAYKISGKNSFKIKKSTYSLNDLFGEEIKGFENGYALIFRLGVSDYHHYIFIDDGTIDSRKIIKGRLHTVRPIAVENESVFIQNSREVSMLHTKNFDNIYMCEVGAMMVGKIINEKTSGKFKRGEEKGYFKFGGSTIILLVNNINIDENKLEVYDSSIADYVKKIDDGTKINVSPKLNQDTKINGLDIKNIQLTCKNGITTLLADVLNNTNKDSEIKNINIKFLDENNKEIRTVNGYIPALKIGETTKLNVSMSSNLIMAYDIKFSEK